MDVNQDFRLFLQDELVRRVRTKPGYSMRAFARFLGVDSSRLSKMLRGERPIKPHFVETFGLKIGLGPDKIETFKASVVSRRNSRNSNQPKREYKPLELDTFEIISDPNHYAVLELMNLADFRPEAKWIAKKLRMQVSEVHAVIERLIRVQLLSVSEDGTWKDLSSGFTTHVVGPNISTPAHRRHQEQILKQALEALSEIPIEKRDQSSMTMAVSSDRLDQAKEMIKDFRRQLCEFLVGGSQKDAVYQLSVSLFPVTTTTTSVEANESLDFV